MNEELIKGAMRKKKWITTTEIIELTGLYRSTINGRLRDLNRYGIVLSRHRLHGNELEHYLLEHI